MQPNDQQPDAASAKKKLSDIESGVLNFLSLISTVSVKLNVDISSDYSEYGQSALIIRNIIADFPVKASKLKEALETITALKNAIN